MILLYDSIINSYVDKFSCDFLNFMCNELKYWRINSLIAARNHYFADNKIEKDVIVLDSLFSRKFITDSAMPSVQYKKYLYSYISHHVRSLQTTIPDNIENHFKNRYHFASLAFAGETRDYMLSQIIYSFLQSTDNMYNGIIADFMYSNSSKYKNITDTLYKNLQKLQKGKLFDDFTLADCDGNEISLSDFEGRFVYIFFFNSLFYKNINPQIDIVNNLIDAVSDKKIVFIGIDANPQKSTANINFKGKILRNPDWQCPELKPMRNLFSSTIIIGPDRHIALMPKGAFNKHQVVLKELISNYQPQKGKIDKWIVVTLVLIVASLL